MSSSSGDLGLAREVEANQKVDRQTISKDMLTYGCKIEVNGKLKKRRPKVDKTKLEEENEWTENLSTYQLLFEN